MMRILFFTACYKPYLGGAERVVEQLCRRLSLHPDVEKVGIVTSHFRFPSQVMPGLPAQEEMDGATVFRLRFIPPKAPGFYHLETGLCAPCLGKVLRRFKATHIHYMLCDWFLPNLQAYGLSRHYAAQVSTIFEHAFSPRLNTWLFRRINQWFATRVDVVHVVSKRAIQVVNKTFCVPIDRTVIIPLGTEVKKRSPDHGDNQPVTILSVGRLCPGKGQMNLVRCFLRVREKVSKPCRLVLIGDDGGDRERIQQLVNKHGLQGSVIMPGFIKQHELEKWYTRSDVFTLLTKDESFGLVFTEAMSCGLPVVTYAVGGVPELLLKSGAILHSPGDVQAVENTLLKLIQDSSLRIKLADEAHSFALHHMSWDRMVEHLIQVYKRIDRRRTYRSG